MDISEIKIFSLFFRFPIYPDRYVHFLLWIYRKSDMDISKFRYIQTDMSIFSYGYIGMDISEMMTSEVSEISISDIFRFPIYPDRYVHFLLWIYRKWTYRKWRHQMYRKCIDFRYVHFRYPYFPINHPFYPLPEINTTRTTILRNCLQ